MAYENIRFRKPNITIVDGYFWMLDEDIDSIVVKTDDGTIAYSYPLDTTLSTSVKGIEYDGYNLWSMEQSGNNLVIRRWYINNYVCTLRSTFNLVASAQHTFSSSAFTVEHYHTTFSANESSGQSVLSISDGTHMDTGYTLVLGPNSSGQVEEVTVSNALADSVIINGTTSNSYEAGDPISFYKRIWVFNNYNGTDSSSGALYKIDAYTGSIISKTAGGAYKDILAATFFDVPTYILDRDEADQTLVSDSICYIKGTNLIFLNPDDLTSSYGSMTMDNVEDDQATNISVYDLVMNETNIYRLQRKATYYGTTSTFADTTYNYQLATLRPFITSISMSADPAILPANGVSNSTITIIVKDQFNEPISGRIVTVTDDDTTGAILNETPSTDSDGIATTIYRSGTSAREVRITSTAQQT